MRILQFIIFILLCLCSISGHADPIPLPTPATTARMAFTQALLQSLQDVDDDSLRMIAAAKCGEYHITEAVPLLADIVQHDKSAEVRQNSAVALGAFHLKQAETSLLAALQDTDAAVRCRSATSLRENGNRLAVAPLLQCLQDRDSSVRYSALWTLAYLPDPTAVAPVIA